MFRHERRFGKNRIPDICRNMHKRGRTWAEINVADHGIGIPAECQGRLFERFYRIDKDRSRALGGTGLGLAIVKHIAQLHGGEVRVVSAPGNGATFFLTF